MLKLVCWKKQIYFMVSSVLCYVLKWHLNNKVFILIWRFLIIQT